MQFCTTFLSSQEWPLLLLIWQYSIFWWLACEVCVLLTLQVNDPQATKLVGLASSVLLAAVVCVLLTLQVNDPQATRLVGLASSVLLAAVVCVLLTLQVNDPQATRLVGLASSVLLAAVVCVLLTLQVNDPQATRLVGLASSVLLAAVEHFPCNVTQIKSRKKTLPWPEFRHGAWTALHLAFAYLDRRLFHTDVETRDRAQEVCESRGGRPGLPSLINLRFLWM